MQNTLVHLDSVKTPLFVCDQMELGEGGVKVVSVDTVEQGNAFVDALMGLSQPESGCVKLMDQNLYQKSETSRLRLLAEVGHVGGGLISNLKVWENLVLPASFHGRVNEVEAEKRLLAALEVLVSTPAINHLIRDGRTFQIPGTMQTGKAVGMQLLNEELAQLVRNKKVDAEEALGRSVDKDDLAKRIGRPVQHSGSHSI
jgi:hypothetical protein